MKRLLSRVIRFGITRRLRRGIKITIFPSYICNFKCKYCTLRSEFQKGTYPKEKNILPLEEWKGFLLKFDESMRKHGGVANIILSGGEPTLLPYFTELVNWILHEQKWHLTVFSNLTNPDIYEYIKPSIRFRIGATCHQHDDPVSFDRRYKKVNAIHRVDVEEIEVKRLKYSKVKPLITEEEIYTFTDSIRVSPNMTIHMSCYDAVKQFYND